MGISIAVATHNRAEELGHTLASLSGLIAEDQEYEILIIDNASTDQTLEVVGKFLPRFGGRLRYIFEERLGLSHARNRAIAEARCEIIGFLDDDVDIEPHWVERMTEAFGSGDLAAVGGRAVLAYSVPRPAWLDEVGECLLTKVDLGTVRRLAQADELYGLNLCIRKDWIDRVGWFRTDLGRIGDCLLSSEEEELLNRIVAVGGVLLYEPEAVVAHRVPANRLRRRWFLSRTYWGKRGHARMIPQSEVCGYQLVRSTWHVGLASWQLTLAALRHGPASQNSFQKSKLLAGRVGFWVGLTGRLWSGFRHRSSGTTGHDTSQFQAQTTASSVPELPARIDQQVAPSVAARG
ncbi:MAG: glycosyltransferase family A protein [Isosphaeraceae bacterium]